MPHKWIILFLFALAVQTFAAPKAPWTPVASGKEGEYRLARGVYTYGAGPLKIRKPKGIGAPFGFYIISLESEKLTDIIAQNPQKSKRFLKFLSLFPAM